MAATTVETVKQSSGKIDNRTRVGGAWLAIGAILSLSGLLLHPLTSPEPSEVMAAIAAAPTQWMAAHWLSVIGASLLVIGGLIVLTTDSRLIDKWWTMTAWAVVILASIGIGTAGLVEAAVSTAAALEGDTATFEAWWVFALAIAPAFGVMEIALGVVAYNEARNGAETTPVWASWIGALAGLSAAVAYALLLLGIAPMVTGILFFAATIVLFLWVLWFGVALARTEASPPAQSRAPDTAREDIG